MGDLIARLYALRLALKLVERDINVLGWWPRRAARRHLHHERHNLLKRILKIQIQTYDPD
jgi:hypothetical protein